MNIGFIGAGKVGTAFGKYLSNNGFNVKGYYSRSEKSAQNAARFCNSRVYSSINELTHSADIILITTNDDEIAKIVEKLTKENILSTGQIVVHMSGASSSEILKAVKEKGCFTYSLHPLQAFADIEKAVMDLENTVFSIEGDKEKIHILEEILKATGNKYFKITKEQKSIYHAGACVVSNYLVTLMDWGLSLFESIGIKSDDGYKALYPLIEGTIKNIHKLGPEKALTGPIARGDVETVENHIKSIKNTVQDKMDFYRLMGNMTLELAKKDRLNDNKKIKELQNILRGEGNGE